MAHPKLNVNSRSLAAVLAVRNKGSRLYGKPLQNLDVARGVTILDNIIDCLSTVDCIHQTALAIAEGSENIVFADYARQNELPFVFGDEVDVLGRLIACGVELGATDIFRVTSESPFPSYEFIQDVWDQHVEDNADATFFDDVIDGCGFEIIKLGALQRSHEKGAEKHRSELCTLYLRENKHEFKLKKIASPCELNRQDLRLTVDNPEDLVLCKAVYENFYGVAPRIPIRAIVQFLDRNPSLIALTRKFTDEGYKSMYK